MHNTVPIPEAPETIEAQLQWLREGRRAAVLLPPGSIVPDLRGRFALFSSRRGVIVYDGCRVTPETVLAADLQDTLPELLGYGIDEMPARPAAVVVVRGPDGQEKQSVLTDSERLDKVRAAAQEIKGLGDTVQVEDGRRVVSDRLKSLDARELRVRPYDPSRDERALEQAARLDSHAPLNPTHVIEREDEIVGYFGISSLPLYRLWFHSEKMKAADSLRLLFMIENHYRMAGVPLVGTIINQQSPFYNVAARGGYVQSTGDCLFLKEL